ncbi:hypothetical protein BLNAU_17340 [Blattamonas nauphoetae]|uniref:Transmembrane protein n=1 Tax=Blattamonas nauphoetae TaxID=2049346 RepID=A0ABQ9XC12_9EUKA|nr:hypothetical protein BLNAU_17340 [Blattamonas nauphoetae]
MTCAPGSPEYTMNLIQIVFFAIFFVFCTSSLIYNECTTIIKRKKFTVSFRLLFRILMPICYLCRTIALSAFKTTCTDLLSQIPADFLLSSMADNMFAGAFIACIVSWGTSALGREAPENIAILLLGVISFTVGVVPFFIILLVFVEFDYHHNVCEGFCQRAHQVEVIYKMILNSIVAIAIIIFGFIILYKTRLFSGIKKVGSVRRSLLLQMITISIASIARSAFLFIMSFLSKRGRPVFGMIQTVIELVITIMMEFFVTPNMCTTKQKTITPSETTRHEYDGYQSGNSINSSGETLTQSMEPESTVESKNDPAEFTGFTEAYFD